ncbi:MAG: phenylalanine--tRNA ligase subunit beta, partial [Christensenellales bacterium]
MLAPISWLKDFVDIDITPEQLQQKLFSCGFEVDQIIEVGKDITGVYVGFVEECEKIEGTHLSKCVVNVGDKGTFQICCGADNVRKGKKFPVALEGATVYSHDKNNPDKKELFTIKNTKIRGVESFGMLCAGDELGVSENMYKGAGYNGLLELSDDAVVGQDFKKAIDLVDYVLEIEIPASRPDCQSIFGIAREVAAVLGKPFKMPKTNFDEIQKEINFEVEVKDFDLCPRYMAHYVSGVKVEQAPQWMRKRLELVGVNSINNIVDITNYVLKEIGQPLHSFDKALLNNNKLVVRRARENEEFKALNDQTYALNTNNLVIADGEKAVALAGVMGGANSGINQDTKEVMFESATFERSSVRKTSRALGLASDSSARFEKGVDEFSTVLGLNRALSLVQELNAGQITNVRFVKAKNPEIKEKYLTVSINKINELLGIEIP